MRHRQPHLGTTLVAPNNGDYHTLPYFHYPPPPPAHTMPAEPPPGTGTAPTTPPAAPPATDPLGGIMGMLDGEVMGIPIKYIAIGLAVYFLMKK